MNSALLAARPPLQSVVEDGVARVEAAGGVGDGGGVEGLAAAEVVALEKDFAVASHCHGCSFF